MKTRVNSTDRLSKAARVVVESLESRQMMAAVGINFQPASSAVPGGMIPDTGATYASRNGYTYGWEANISANTVQRTTSYTSYQRYKTFVQTQKNGDHKWEIALSSGKYTISAAGGDPTEYNSKINFTAEGTTLLLGTTTSSTRFIKGTKTIDVTDGKLTILNGSGAVNNKLMWISFERIGDASTSGNTGGGSTGGGSTGTPAPSSFVWQPIKQSDVGHTEPETATIGSKVYIFSGYQTNYIPGPRVDVFDMNTKTWSRKKDMPLPFTHSAVAVVGTDVWFAGGYILKPGSTTSQQTYLKDVWRYDSVNDTWKKEGELPDWRGSSGMVHKNGKLYLFSGDDKYRTNPVTTTWVFDLNNRSAGWKSLAPIPKGRSHFGIVELDGYVYIIGGQKLIDEESIHFSDCWRYDIANNSWKQIASYPTVISHVSPSTFVYNGRIIVAGGETHFNHSISNVREYNPATNTWRSLTSLPAVRAAGVASHYDNKLFFTGGKDGGTIKKESWWAELGL